MEAIKQKMTSCKCPKERTNAAGQRDCGACGTGVECTCKVNKCKCASCPNARKKTKEGGDATSSSSSSDEEGSSRRRTAGAPPAAGTTTTTTL
ncbi:hypothetical protein P389DRAFT_191858 [Cystobasidium minutum MCA 4210]|uniref:uncharacterized protein n=1 Tax=Cystobasidium minutum MCA 4210 TaxID=1397322 RepID=UPI0034CF4E65|eukprot:jgi/Rhomi1/191858/gm1.72_g